MFDYSESIENIEIVAGIFDEIQSYIVNGQDWLERLEPVARARVQAHLLTISEICNLANAGLYEHKRETLTAQIPNTAEDLIRRWNEAASDSDQ